MHWLYFQLFTKINGGPEPIFGITFLCVSFIEFSLYNTLSIAQFQNQHFLSSQYIKQFVFKFLLRHVR